MMLGLAGEAGSAGISVGTSLLGFSEGLRP